MISDPLPFGGGVAQQLERIKKRPENFSGRFVYLEFVAGLAVIAVALMLLFDFLSASGTLFRGQVLEEFDYVLNHFYQLLLL